MPHVNYFIRPLGDVADDVVLPKSHAAMLSSDVATLESCFTTVASYVDDDVGCHVGKFLGGLGFCGVFILMFRETHVCSCRHSMCFRVFGRMHVLTVCMSNLTLSDIATNISCDYCVSSSYEHVHLQCH